jgi:hypothetical protein
MLRPPRHDPVLESALGLLIDRGSTLESKAPDRLLSTLMLSIA